MLEKYHSILHDAHGCRVAEMTTILPARPRDPGALPAGRPTGIRVMTVHTKQGVWPLRAVWIPAGIRTA